jgi:hypothetical protein
VPLLFTVRLHFLSGTLEEYLFFRKKDMRIRSTADSITKKDRGQPRCIDWLTSNRSDWRICIIILLAFLLENILAVLCRNRSLYINGIWLFAPCSSCIKRCSHKRNHFLTQFFTSLYFYISTIFILTKTFFFGLAYQGSSVRNHPFLHCCWFSYHSSLTHSPPSHIISCNDCGLETFCAFWYFNRYSSFFHFSKHF